MQKLISKGRQFWSETRWFLLGILWLVGIILGYAGFNLFARQNSHNWTISDIFYRTLQLVILESGSIEGNINWMLDTARFVLPALTAYTALQAITHLFLEQSQWLRLWQLRDHIIVCGLGRKGSHLIADLIEQGGPVVVIEKEANHEHMTQLRRQGVIILAGDATDPAILRSARIQRAAHLISLLGEDSQNIQVAIQAYKLRQERSRGRLTCMVHLNSPELLNLIKNSELTTDPRTSFQLETFNAYARAARVLLQSDPGWQAVEPAQEIPYQVLLVGMGRFGENLVLQACFAWHLLKRQNKLHITVVDREANQKVSTLLSKQPQLKQTCQLTPIEVDLVGIKQLSNLLQTSSGNQTFHQVYICLSDPVLGLQISLNLIQTLGLLPACIQVRLASESGLSELIRNPLPGLVDATLVRTFDLYEQTCSADLLVSGSHELLARDLHAVYVAGTREACADPSELLAWDQLSMETKEANRRQADRIHQLLKASGYRIIPLHDWDAAEHSFYEEEIFQIAQQEHTMWRQAKEADGWTLGSTRDDQQRTHPDLVPWEDLEEGEREKNLTFVRQLPALLARIGFQIERL